MAKITRVAPEIPSADLQGALAYYEQKLGFRIAMRMPDYAIIERDDVALHLFLDSSGQHSPIGIHLFCAELDVICRELQRNGAFVTQGITRKPWGNRDFRVKDEFGNELKFTEPLEDN
jgi:uncharacterized glyoxalase superfamily protein PhnB